MPTRASLRFLPLLLGLLLVPLFVARIGTRAIAENLRQIGPGALWILVPYALGTALSALPWARLLPAPRRPDMQAVIASRFAASGANALLPFFGVAGEPCRLLWLPRALHPQGLAAIVVDRLQYNAAGGLVLLVAALAALGTPLPRSASAAAAGLGVLLVAASALVIGVIGRKGIGRGVRRVLDRILGRAYREPELGARVEAELRALSSSGARGTRREALLLHFVARLAVGIELYVALWALHAPARPADALVLASVPIATSVIASSIPSQLGVQEGAQAVVCGALGLDPALGLVVTLLQRARQLAFVPVTLLLLATARARHERAAER